MHSTIGVETSLPSGVRGARIAARFKIFRHRSPAYATDQDREVRYDLVRAVEDLEGPAAGEQLVEPRRSRMDALRVYVHLGTRLQT